MNKYIKAIEQKADDSLPLLLLTVLMAIAGVGAFAVATVATKGLTLLAALVWWVYIVYKEANKDET